jgi:hypothetical protein
VRNVDHALFVVSALLYATDEQTLSFLASFFSQPGSMMEIFKQTDKYACCTSAQIRTADFGPDHIAYFWQVPGLPAQSPKRAGTAAASSDGVWRICHRLLVHSIVLLHDPPAWPQVLPFFRTGMDHSFHRYASRLQIEHVSRGIVDL